MRLTRLASGALLFLALGACVAFGQVQRTFVSGSGSDSNPCSRAAPCRTIGQAISQTNPGGEVAVLDSAGYGPFSINKSISIISAPGVYAGISVFSGDGIDIHAGASDVVILRGLSINGQNRSGSQAICCNSVGTLRIDSCVLRGFSFNGVGFVSAGTLLIEDTVINDCSQGINLQIPPASGAGVTIDHVTVTECFGGIRIVAGFNASTVAATVRDSNVSNVRGGSGYGISAVANSGGVARVDLERCLVSNEHSGVIVATSQGGTPSMSISNCVITRNSNGFIVSSGATLYTRGNNTIIGNGSTSGSLTPLPAQ